MDKQRKSKESKVDFEKCVCCGAVTDVPRGEHISRRAYYIEGAGQLCVKCHAKIYKPHIAHK